MSSRTVRIDETTYMLLKKLAESAVKTPYEVVERREGFAENGGETTLLLIKNLR